MAGGRSGATGESEDGYLQSHGSGASSAAWMLRGGRAGTMAACNTWGAPADQVS
jgi:hypothetical protein